MLEQYNCGCILVHHTPKTTYQNKEEWKTSDWMYACTGSADVTNWARAILVIAAVKDDDKMFAWVAAKRGKRLEWADEEGKNTVAFKNITNMLTVVRLLGSIWTHADEECVEIAGRIYRGILKKITIKQ